MKFTTIFSALFAAAVSVSAAPLAKQARDVWDPKMTFPVSGTVLQSGQTILVTWYGCSSVFTRWILSHATYRETADQPAHITNTDGLILLRTESTETPVVLAHDFDIRAGNVSVVVPEVLTRDDYSFVRT